MKSLRRGVTVGTEVVTAARSRSRLWIALAVAVALAGALTGGLLVGLAGQVGVEAPAQPPEAPAPAPAPARPASHAQRQGPEVDSALAASLVEVRFQLQPEPEHASITIDGEAVIAGTASVSSGEAHEIVVDAPGFESFRERRIINDDTVVVVALTPLVSPVPQAKSRPGARRPPPPPPRPAQRPGEAEKAPRSRFQIVEDYPQ